MANTTLEPNAARNATLYINNLAMEIKMRDMKSALRALFGIHGEVLDVHMRKAIRMRGQAFVVMDSEESAQRAMQALQSHTLYDRPMHISFAKTVSDLTVQRAGGSVTRSRHERMLATPTTTRRRPTIQHAEEKNRILFLDELALTRTKEDLLAVVSGYDGFEEVQVVQLKAKKVAFVTFRDEDTAESAMRQCGDWNLPEEFKISFAAK